MANACAYEGCDALGIHPAPKSRIEIRNYLWFCLKHVREYNQKWDYYKGMSRAAIEQSRYDHRLGNRHTNPTANSQKNTQNIWESWQTFKNQSVDHTSAKIHHPDKNIQQALDTLHLDWPVAKDVVKLQYYDLAKKHHPDNGAKDNGEHLKKINKAYKTLSVYLEQNPC